MNFNKTKKKMLRDSTVMSVALIIGRILAIPTSIIKAYTLGPLLLGVLNIVNLIQKYVSFNSFGLIQSFVREGTIAISKDDKRECEEIRDITFSGNVIITIITVFILWSLFLCGITLKETLNLSIMILVSLILILNRAGLLLISHARVIGMFNLIAKKDLIVNLTQPLMVIPLVIFLKVEGVLINAVIVNLTIIIFFLCKLEKIKFNFLLPIKKTIYLAKIGFMVFLTNIAVRIFWIVDLTIVASMLSVREVGIFGFALGALTLAENLPNTLNPMIYRHLLVKKGEFAIEQDSTNYQKYMESPNTGYILLCSIIAGCSLFLYAFIVNVFLPQFCDSITVLEILIFGFMIYKSRVFASFYLNVTDQLGKLFLFQYIGILLNIILDIALVSKGYGIVGVAWGSTTSYIVFSAIIVIFSMRQIYGNYRIPLIFIAKLIGISCLLMAVIIFSNSVTVFPYQSFGIIYLKIMLGTADVIVKIAIFTAICVFTYCLLFKEQNLFKDVKVAVLYIIDIIKKNTLKKIPYIC